jgi:hypothetical protein
MKKKELIKKLSKRLDQIESDNLILLTRVAKLESKFDNCEMPLNIVYDSSL